MALNPTRIANLRTAGWLMLTAFTTGLIAAVVKILWENQYDGATIANAFANADSTSLAYALIALGNLTALISAVGIAVSAKPAGLTRAFVYAALGAALEFATLLLTTMTDESGLNPSAPYVFHLIVTIVLVLALVRKAQLRTRALILRSVVVAGTWTLAIAAIATLTYPFSQYGSGTSATEASDVHQLRQISNRLLDSMQAELTGGKAPRLNAISGNSASILGFNNLDCKFNQAQTFFDAFFPEEATLKNPVPKLVANKDFDPKAATDSAATGTAYAESPYTAASEAAVKNYWSAATKRIAARIGTLPEGWRAQYRGGSRFDVTLRNDQRKLSVAASLNSSEIDGRALTYFSAHAAGCYPLEKAPFGTR